MGGAPGPDAGRPGATGSSHRRGPDPRGVPVRAVAYGMEALVHSMIIDLGSEVGHQPGPAGLVAMTQQVADHFATTIRRRPQDWPMLQPFFGPLVLSR